MPQRFLVIGCGSIGKRHIGNLLALEAGDVLGFDIRADRRGEVEARFGIEALDALDDAWSRDIDAAVVTSPTSLHVPLAIQAAEHGCHLFIEKPLGDSLDGVDPLLDLVRTRNLVSLVGCNMRFHPSLRTIKKLLEEEAIGQVVSARAEFGQYLPDWHPGEDYTTSYSASEDQGGGVILDAIHEIDYLRWMLGEVEAVGCLGGKLSHLDIETEDTAAILLRFASGAIGEVHMDYVQRAYRRTCQVVGTEGTILWNWEDDKVRLYTAATQGWRGFKNPPAWEPNAMYVDEMRHFIRCLAREEKPAQDLVQARHVLEVALAAKASLESGLFVSLKGGS